MARKKKWRRSARRRAIVSRENQKRIVRWKSLFHRYRYLFFDAARWVWKHIWRGSTDSSLKRMELQAEALEPRQMLSSSALNQPEFDLLTGEQATNSAFLLDGLGNKLGADENDLDSAFVFESVDPNLELVDTDLSKIKGQIVFLDFDGADNVTYDGPITFGNLSVPAFSLDGTPQAGQEERVISQITTDLNVRFEELGVSFTTEEPLDGIYSTIFIGGDDSAFREHGHFYGLAENVDVGNQNRSDEAFVFSENLQNVLEVSNTIAHEAGHLIGMEHRGVLPTSQGELRHVALAPLDLDLFEVRIDGSVPYTAYIESESTPTGTSINGNVVLGLKDNVGQKNPILTSDGTFTWTLNQDGGIDRIDADGDVSLEFLGSDISVFNGEWGLEPNQDLVALLNTWSDGFKRFLIQV